MLHRKDCISSLIYVHHKEWVMSLILVVSSPFPSLIFFPSSNTQMWGKQILPSPNFLEERHFKFNFIFSPFFSPSLEKEWTWKQNACHILHSSGFFAVTTAYFSLSPASSVAATVLSRQLANIFYFHGYHLPSDAVAPPADHRLPSLPGLQNCSVRNKGSWPLEFKPDEWYL